MPSCDMCGSQGKLVRALIEGTELNVCQQCAKFGKVLKIPVTFVKKQVIVKQPKPEPLEIIVSDYNSIIKKKREELGITQEELAIKIAERESIINKVEAGQMEPSISLAKKLEKLLEVKLIEVFEDKGGALSTKTKTAEFTIGDSIILKRRKAKGK